MQQILEEKLDRVIKEREFKWNFQIEENGKGVTRKWFEKNVVPNGKFLKKIGDTYFYWSPN